MAGRGNNVLLAAAAGLARQVQSLRQAQRCLFGEPQSELGQYLRDLLAHCQGVAFRTVGQHCVIIGYTEVRVMPAWLEGCLVWRGGRVAGVGMTLRARRGLADARVVNWPGISRLGHGSKVERIGLLTIPILC